MVMKLLKLYNTLRRMSIGNEKDFQTVGNMKIFDKRLGNAGFRRKIYRLGLGKTRQAAARRGQTGGF